jgi:hypothetical protein
MNIPTISLENPIIHRCHVAAELDYLESAARNLLRMDDTARRSAASVRAIVAVARKKHRHAAQCGLCLVNEALANAAPRKPGRSSFISGAQSAGKAVIYG